MGKIDKCTVPENANLTCENLRRMQISLTGKIDKCSLKGAKECAALKSTKDKPGLTYW